MTESYIIIEVIAAEGEQQASRALREAADVISESSSALQVGCHVMSCHVMSCHVMSCHVMSCHVMTCSAQLRYLQTLGSISADHNSTIIFPMPINIIDHFMSGKTKA